MAMRFGLLTLLADEPAHGYELKTGLERAVGGSWAINVGQVYSTLSRLARDGKVVMSETPGEGPERKQYVITDLGATEVDTWLTEPVEPEPHLQTVLFAKVVLALACAALSPSRRRPTAA